MTDLLLGIDIGTTNVKTVLTSADGHVVAESSLGYPTSHPRSGWAEQDPHDWWNCAVVTTRNVLADAVVIDGQVKAIGVSGQGCAVTLIDPRGEIIRPAIIWMDSRSEPQCDWLRSCCAKDILRINGKQPAPYNADPTLMWLQAHEPDSIVAARTNLTSTGYVNFCLTGNDVENVSDASILYAFDLANECWSEPLIDAFGLPRRLYPALAPCQALIGKLTAKAAGDMGLAAGIPVVAGGEDTSSAGLAIGVTQPGQALLSLGTAGTIYIAEDQPSVHPQLLAFLHVLPGQTLLGGSIISGGAGLNWYRQLWPTDISYHELTQLAQQSEPGARGLLFLPYLSGELQPINDGNARGLFFGLSMATSQADMVRAIFEGTAYAIAHNLTIAAQTTAQINEIRAVGAPTHNPFWCQVLADVCGYPLATMGNSAGAPLGNALLAGAGIGLIDDVAKAAASAASIARVYEPRPAVHDLYQELLPIYTELYPQLKEQFGTLAAWTTNRTTGAA